MKIEVERPFEILDCDGCSYSIKSRPSTANPWPPDTATSLSIPWKGDVLEFHFHRPNDRNHDCFRYWAHNPSTMLSSLKERKLSTKEIDEFMGTHLYRSGAAWDKVGVARPS